MVKKKFHVRWSDGALLETEGFVFGNWTAHIKADLTERRYDWGGSWRVTHLPSGACIATLVDGLTKAQATRVAQALSDRYPLTEEDGSDVDPERNVALFRDPEDQWIVSSIVAEALSL